MRIAALLLAFASGTALAFTTPPTPLPSADHVLPFQRAMLVVVTPPALVNGPPT